MISIDGVMPITKSQYHELTNDGAAYLINKEMPKCLVRQRTIICDQVEELAYVPLSCGGPLYSPVGHEKFNFRIEFNATIGK